MSKKSYVGGFVAQNKNEGSIIDCYSLVRFNGKNYLSGGFAGENTGSIKTSFSDVNIKGLTGGFCANDVSSKTEKCYFLHKEKSGSKKIEKLTDRVNGQRKDEIRSTDSLYELGFDTENVWEYKEDEYAIRFIEEKWFQKIEYEESDEVIVIKNAKELSDFAENVNKGDKKFTKANVRLESDIDLNGREWEPIGNARTVAFSGVFNGNGYVIKNFSIKSKNKENKGFFGFLKGEVYNLTVDCIIKGIGCCGALVAQNTGGTIGCCAAVLSVRGNKKNAVIGGLVGVNSGKIFKSYTAGNFKFFFIPILPIFSVVGSMLAIGTAGVVLITSVQSQPIYQEIPEDGAQVPIPGDSEVQKTESNFVSFQFEREVSVDLLRGIATLNFKNPGSSNHNVVVQLQVTEKLAKSVMGGTGRNEAEQAEIEARADYNDEAYRITIASSKSISPGYQVTSLVLTDFAKMNLPAGTYNAIIYIIPYDVHTNGRAMLETQLPVTITVK